MAFPLLSGIYHRHSPCRSASMCSPIPFQTRTKRLSIVEYGSGLDLGLIRHRKAGVLVARMALRGVDSFDAHVTLKQSEEEALLKLLTSPKFCNQVASQTKQVEGVKLEFAGHLFQPVPWSPATKRGMPSELEHLLDDPSHVVINVPPNFMFAANISSPTRLCAVYRRQ